MVIGVEQSIDPGYAIEDEDHSQGLSQKKKKKGQVTYEWATPHPFHQSDASKTYFKSQDQYFFQTNMKLTQYNVA